MEKRLKLLSCFSTTSVGGVATTYLERQSWTSNTAPCNGVVSHGAPIGGIQIFADHKCKIKHKQNASIIFACHAAFHACLSSYSDRIRWHRWQETYTPDESRLFWSREKSKYPNWNPMLGRNWRRSLNLRFKSVVAIHRLWKCPCL